MTPRLRGWLAALPDTTTAVAFALAWAIPNEVGLPFVRTMFVAFLLEFFAVHAGGMLAGGASPKARPAPAPVPRPASEPWHALPIALGAMALFYLSFAAAVCVALGTWWPFVAFALVLLAKLVPLFAPAPGTDAKQATGLWVLSVLWYLGAVFATLFLPLPALGLDEATRTALDLPGSGEWIDAPEKPLAAGVIYFTLMAWTRGKTAHG
ncbi:MAG TPA: hypothetical protein VFO79_16465 [Xanthomonadales bacterium]|nr:hypothetical protein [Xanthomonadales bacterium]